MRDYLVDTNIWEYWFNQKREPFHTHVLGWVEKIKRQESRLWISVITWGEIEYGYRSMTDKERSLENEFRKFTSDQSPIVYRLDKDNKHVTAIYGRIRAKLFERFGPEAKKGKGMRPEQLIDPITAKELGIQENDLWIAAQALTRDMILVTNDKKLIKPIKLILGDELTIENWAESQDSGVGV